jgi:hypothetical protein
MSISTCLYLPHADIGTASVMLHMLQIADSNLSRVNGCMLTLLSHLQRQTYTLMLHMHPVLCCLLSPANCSLVWHWADVWRPSSVHMGLAGGQFLHAVYRTGHG